MDSSFFNISHTLFFRFSRILLEGATDITRLHRNRPTPDLDPDPDPDPNPKRFFIGCIISNYNTVDWV